MSSFSIRCRFAEYDLFKPTISIQSCLQYIYKFSYKFDTVLYQFHETGTSDKTFMGLDYELK